MRPHAKRLLFALLVITFAPELRGSFGDGEIWMRSFRSYFPAESDAREIGVRSHKLSENPQGGLRLL